jgi:hypothetical protein
MSCVPEVELFSRKRSSTDDDHYSNNTALETRQGVLKCLRKKKEKGK